MGAIVRAFDTRAAAREQVESLGGEFLEISMKEDGAGAGGYAKTMSKEFIEEEMRLFMNQCQEVDIVITTALIPGKPAPKLITRDMIAAMKQGSVVVDLAAEGGGNCEVTVPGQLHVHDGVSVIGLSHFYLWFDVVFTRNSRNIGYTDLPSRLPTQSSTLYSNNITKFLLYMGANKQHSIDLEDEVIRRSIVLQRGELLWPAPPPPQPTVAAPATPAPAAATAKEVTAVTPFKKAATEVAVLSTALGGVVALGKATGPAFMSNVFTFGLAGLIGYRAVWGVAPALVSCTLPLGHSNAVQTNLFSTRL
jgi:NAD(P) transhydrogenase